jgi:methionyl-tRNA formyltransferase
MDAGDIYGQFQVTLNKHTNFNQLADQLGNLGKETWALVAALRILEGAKSEDSEMVDTGDFIAKRQDYAQFTKTRMIKKEDRLVDLKEMICKDVYNHFRAYIHYPGTWFESDYFKQEVKILSAKGCINQADFSRLVAKSKSLGEQDEWYVLNIEKQQRVFIKCAEGYIELEKICLSSGKNIDFAGYIFEFKDMVI